MPLVAVSGPKCEKPPGGWQKECKTWNKEFNCTNRKHCWPVEKESDCVLKVSCPKKKSSAFITESLEQVTLTWPNRDETPVVEMVCQVQAKNIKEYWVAALNIRCCSKLKNLKDAESNCEFIDRRREYRILDDKPWRKINSDN